MSFFDRLKHISRVLKLDSHHATERLGVITVVLALSGVGVFAGAGASAWENNQVMLDQTAVYSSSFTLSRTGLKGDVDGVYTNTGKTRTLVMMHVTKSDLISHDADDYRAFLLGTDTSLHNVPVATPGVTGQVIMFGTTGYIGVVLEAPWPFVRQVLNLTIRSTTELVTGTNETAPEAVEDISFAQHDQWRVYFNPAGGDAPVIPALNDETFDPARAFYDIIIAAEEQAVRDGLDQSLLEMRADLTKISSYTADLLATSADGLSLKEPVAPASLAGDQVSGDAATQDKQSTLTLVTDTIIPSCHDFDWRNRSVYQGYLESMVPAGQSISGFFAEKKTEGRDTAPAEIASMRWILSDGSDLARDHKTTDVVLRPLVQVMDNLTTAYKDYSNDKAAYQCDGLAELLNLDVRVRDVADNSSVNHSDAVLTVHY